MKNVVELLETRCLGLAVQHRKEERFNIRLDVGPLKSVCSVLDSLCPGGGYTVWATPNMDHHLPERIFPQDGFEITLEEVCLDIRSSSSVHLSPVLVLHSTAVCRCEMLRFCFVWNSDSSPFPNSSRLTSSRLSRWTSRILPENHPKPACVQTPLLQTGEICLAQ